MWGDGRLVHCDGGIEIHVCSRGTPSRRRFTIAHELGHLWASRAGGVGAHVPRDAEERFCDAFAAALLIPRDWLSATAEGGSEGLPALCRLARIAQTSISAMLLRLRDQLGWRGTLLRYRRESGEWRLASVVGSSSQLQRRLSATEETAWALSTLAGRPRILRASLPLGVDGDVFRCRAELSVSPRSALAFTRFRLADEIASQHWSKPLETTIPPKPRHPPVTDELGWRLWALTRSLGTPGAQPFPARLARSHTTAA